MKVAISAILCVLALIWMGCENTSKDVASLYVEFSWEGMKKCDMGNPQMQINGIPDQTKFLKINMYDKAYGFDHGTQRIVYEGSRKIARGKLTEITGPCPPHQPGRYKITVKAIDKNEVIIGIGSMVRDFPEIN